MLRIDSLKPNTLVTLRFMNSGHPYDESAVFLGVTGAGEDRNARFRSVDENTLSSYEWEAYRYLGRWAYGSSAENLRLAAVHS